MTAVRYYRHEPSSLSDSGHVECVICGARLVKGIKGWRQPLVVQLDMHDLTACNYREGKELNKMAFIVSTTDKQLDMECMECHMPFTGDIHDVLKRVIAHGPKCKKAKRKVKVNA